MEMKPRTFVVDPKQRFNPRNERIKPFVERLNKSRVAANYKPYSPAYVAKLMAYIETSELDAFYKMLDQSKNFCALWHYYVKPKKK